MENFARIAKSESFEIVPMGKPFSNFEFFEAHKSKFPRTLRRILSQVRRLGGKTIVIEDLCPSLDVVLENEDLEMLFPDLLPGITRRISFFKKPFKTLRGLKTVKQSEIIGFVVIKEEFLETSSSNDIPPNFASRIFESVITPPHKTNNYIRGGQDWEFLVCDHKFKTKGYIYAQQNKYTNCCAHVAARTAISPYDRSGKISYSEMNKLLGIDHTKKLASEGLEPSEIVNILEHAGANCYNWNIGFPLSKVIPFQKYIYGSIESGYPAIVIFKTETSYHAIPIFGHTLNRDTWVPLADSSYFKIGPTKKYISSESWLSMFVGHDDNFGSNICIPRHYLLAEENVTTSLRTRNVAHVIGTLPKEVKVNPIKAEIVGVDYLYEILEAIDGKRNPWLRRMKESSLIPMKNQFVVRPILINSSEYCAHLAKLEDWNGNSADRSIIEPIGNYLNNELIWLIEFSFLEIFSGNLRKLGEVLVRSETDFESGKRDLEGFLLARIPGSFVSAKIVENKKVEFDYIHSGLENHVQLFGCENS